MGRKDRHTKEKIFEEAARLFSEQGYDATTVRQIAKAAGVNEASIYNHFESKEDILNEIFRVFRQTPKSYIPSVRKIDAYLETDSPVQLLTRFIPSCKGEDALFLTRAYRIAATEQHINPTAKALIDDHLIGEAAESIGYALEKLAESGNLPGLDSGRYTQEWRCRQFSLIIANTMFTAICANGFPEDSERAANTVNIDGSVFSGMYLIDLALSGAGEYSERKLYGSLAKEIG